ncbi:hypothetical protein L2E82_39389 [Cichorium intybus]|uniref:Uncharacterized protein n=1 Tax=Cichorium intybus TaxID=13427 RepID=A0ACB9AJT0_CICIN|nr:hypothetical protein L2E82_39389 [Cichorium intybus]
MLNKRFKIAKCKTSLKLATSRIKLMRNKKVIQINQMKRELAQLLESGQDRTARIRVEHVIREEKMIAAYDLIEIYCELIVARLPIIESQKTCPIDLKEAITSVIFAAPRCSDIPELVDARKNFTAKYGKEFVSAALELRPESGVNRMMVEKLSAVAPDLQTKMKVLTAVAKEHNVNWDPTLFEEIESKPKDDLLNGAMNFEKVNTMNVDTHKIQTSNVQNVHSHEEKLNVPDDFSQQNRRYTLGSQNIDTNPSGMESEMMNRRHSFQSNSKKSSSGRENNWNMEFKDATSAAQAAAESAERASMAARAAAQLSNQAKIKRQYSTESDKKPHGSTTSEVHGQHHFKDSYHNSFNNRNQKIQNPQTDSPKATKEVIRKQSSISSSGSHSNQQKLGQRTFVDQGNRSRDEESDSDDDENPKFDTGFDYDELDAKSFFPSPGREEFTRPIENTRVSSPRNNKRDKQDEQKAQNPRKTRIELNDLVEIDSTIVHESKKEDREPKFVKTSSDLEIGNEIKFRTLTGGRRNKGGGNYPPYMKTGVADSSPSSKKLGDNDKASKPSSFNSRVSRTEKRESSVSMSSSESESDDHDDKFVKNRSRFAPPDVFFNDAGDADSDEEVVPAPKRKPTELSRRTKGYVEPGGKTVISSVNHSTNESPTKRVSEQPPKTSKSNLSSQTSLEANEVKKPSHVHPKLPEYDSLAARIQSLRTKHQ